MALNREAIGKRRGRVVFADCPRYRRARKQGIRRLRRLAKRDPETLRTRPRDVTRGWED